MVGIGGFLGIIIAIKPINGTTGALFSVFLIGFVVTALFAYTSLTSDRDWAGYSITISLLSLCFAGLVTLSFANPLVEALAASNMNENIALLVYGVAVVALWILLQIYVASNLSVRHDREERNRAV